MIAPVKEQAGSVLLRIANFGLQTRIASPHANTFLTHCTMISHDVCAKDRQFRTLLT